MHQIIRDYNLLGRSPQKVLLNGKGESEKKYIRNVSSPFQFPLFSIYKLDLRRLCTSSVVIKLNDHLFVLNIHRGHTY